MMSRPAISVDTSVAVLFRIRSPVELYAGDCSGAKLPGGSPVSTISPPAWMSVAFAAMYQMAGVTFDPARNVRISPSRRSTISPPASISAGAGSFACRLPVAVSASNANSDGRPWLFGV